MPHLVGLQLHTHGITVATLRPDLTFALRPTNDLADVIRRVAAQRGKWSLANEAREEEGIAAVADLLGTLRIAMNGEAILAGVAVPAVWGDRARRCLLRAMAKAGVQSEWLVRDTTGLAAGATLVDPSVQGLCAFVHVGAHKLEYALAEVSPGRITVQARRSVRGLDGSNMRPETVFPLIAEVGRVVADEAGASPGQVRRLVVNGQRALDRALADRMGTLWGIRAEVFPAGTIAVGAGDIALGLTGIARPWTLADDLEEAPRLRLTPEPPRPRLTPEPPPRRPTPEPTPVRLESARHTPVPAPTRRPPPITPPPLAPTAGAHSTIPARPTPSPSAPVLAAVTPPPKPISERPMSHPAIPRPSSHPAIPRPSSPLPMAEPAAEVAASGHFAGVPSLEAMEALSLLTPAGAGALLRPALPVLLNQFNFLRERSGTLSLRHGNETVDLPIERGGVCLPTAEHAWALTPFDWPDGTFSWRPGTHSWEAQRHRVSMTSFVVAGLRSRLRGYNEAAFGQHHRAKMALAPSVPEALRGRLARLSLPEAEARAVSHVLNGVHSFEKVLEEGYLSRLTMHRLVVLLDLYGILHWAPPPQAASDDQRRAMTKLLTKIEGANHFVALEVHWSAPADEIRQAWETVQTQYGSGGKWHRVDPALAARVLARGAAAWAVLRNDDARVKHRREAYPGIDEELLAPLVESRAKALEMRGDKREAAKMMALRGEFHVTLGDPEPVKAK